MEKTGKSDLRNAEHKRLFTTYLIVYYYRSRKWIYLSPGSTDPYNQYAIKIQVNVCWKQYARIGPSIYIVPSANQFDFHLSRCPDTVLIECIIHLH